MNLLASVVEKNVVEWAPRDEDLIPLAMFRGNVPLATLRARWALLMSMKNAEIPSVNDIVRVSEAQPNEIHLCGLHVKTTRLHWSGLFSRICSTPSILALDPHLEEYVRWVSDASRCWIFKMDPISRTSFRSRWQWRHIKRPIGMWVDRHEEVAQYPYLPAQVEATDENELLLLVHRAIPKHFPHELRGDLCQDLIVELLLGEIDRNDIADQLPAFLKRSLRKYPRKYDGISLETAVFEDKTFGEMLSWDKTACA